MTRSLTLFVLLAAVLACTERLTAPAECPELCPGGDIEILETVLAPIAGRDSTFPEVGGYVERELASALRVSNGLVASDDRAVLRFLPREDSVRVADTLRSYTIDSVALSLPLVARDTTVHNLQLLVYRLPPAEVDSTVTFAEVDAQLTAPNLIGSIAIPDTVADGVLRLVLSADELSRVAIPPADSGVLAIGLALGAASPTGVRVASRTGVGGAPFFLTYVQAAVADSTVDEVITRAAEFNTFVSAVTPPPAPDLLVVGGAPSQRSILRYDLPPRLRDTATIIRATIELTPADTIRGLPGDPASLLVTQVLTDLGAKSPVAENSQGNLIASDTTLTLGTAEPVRLDVTSLVRFWQGEDGLPPSLFLRLSPEASSFTRAVFHSTRSGGPAPQLRISYAMPFDFEAP